jgi:hypothetical protein
MNNTYILLRNNSESKPLSLEELKQTGLLPADLLWVECQSMSWRHPHEIPELKALIMESEIPKNKSRNDESFEKYAPQVENTSTANAETNGACVKLPSKGNSLKKQDEPVALKKEPFTATNKEVNNTCTGSSGNHSGNTENKINGLAINDTLPGSDIQETYFRKPAPKEKKDLMESLLSLPPKKIALYAGLVAAGALLMLIIRGTGGNDKVIMQPVSRQPEVLNTEQVIEPAAPAEDSTATPESYNPQNSLIAETTDAPAGEQRTSSPAKPTVPVKKAEEKKETANLANVQPVAKQPAVTGPTVEKTVAAENIASQLLIKANEYNVAAFGGIRNLVMTLQNDSRYFLDKVSVEVRYLNPEGTLVKTDNIDFNFVQPGNTATVAVRKSSRGVKVSYKIINIQSKELAIKNSVPSSASN